MRIDNILIGMDFSETAVAAARWAHESVAPAARMTFVHSIEPAPRPRFALNALPAAETIEAIARDYAERRMHDLSTFLTSRPAATEIRVGRADETIADVAREAKADLIVIGPHGDRPRPHRFLGTTAERIVHRAPVSVLVATNPPAGAPRSILVPVDDASVTPAVLAWARHFAEAFDARVTLLHVWSNAVYSHVASMSFAQYRDEAEARREIDRELHDAAMHWLHEMSRTGLERDRVSARVKYGHAGDEALKMAVAMHAGMIVLGRHGAGLVRPALLGTTVNTVLHGARVPVLVVVE